MEMILRQLLDRLDNIAEEHEEVGDTDVRELMSEAVFNGFLRQTPNFELSDHYAMFSDEGDQLVKQALAEFLLAALILATKTQLASFHERLSAFQDNDVCSKAGSYYDDYFGWADPKNYDAEGTAIRRSST